MHSCKLLKSTLVTQSTSYSDTAISRNRWRKNHIIIAESKHCTFFGQIVHFENKCTHCRDSCAFCVEKNLARHLACEDKTDKYEVCCYNFTFTFCLVVRHNRNMLPILLQYDLHRKKANKTFLIMGYILFPVNHSRPAFMGCSMTTSKLGSHVKDFLHTKDLVLSHCMFLK